MMDIDEFYTRLGEEREAHFAEVIVELGQSKRGRNFLWVLLEKAQVGKNPFSPDPYIQAFQCGQVNIGQQIQDAIQYHSPETYIKMLKDRNNERYQADRLATPGN